MRQPSEGEVMWLAGLIDGEGCIDLRPHSSRSYMLMPAIYIANRNEELLKKIQDIFGGVFQPNRKFPNSESCGHVAFYGHDAERIGRLVQPYLIVKKALCDILLQWCDYRLTQKCGDFIWGRGATEKDIEFLTRFYSKRPRQKTFESKIVQTWIKLVKTKPLKGVTDNEIMQLFKGEPVLFEASEVAKELRIDDCTAKMRLDDLVDNEQLGRVKLSKGPYPTNFYFHKKYTELVLNKIHELRMKVYD